MDQQEEKDLKIHRGRCDSLKIYEVTEGELAAIERGSPNSIFLNFSIFFLSIAISFLMTLLTVGIASIRLFIVFIVLTILGFMMGIFLLLLWYRNNNDFSDTVEKIKARLKEEEQIEKISVISIDPTIKEI